MTEHETLYLEARLTPTAEKTGKEWDVTIIGATSPADVVQVEGREYIKSKNGRLYSIDAIKESAGQWDGVKVYDNHLTQAEFEAKQGMRSPVKEWLGTIVKPYWDDASKQLRGAFKVVEDALASKLKNAHEQGVLGAIGLSIDTFPITGRTALHEGQQMPLIEGFKKILSVDLVGDPAAGGGFNRILAAVQDKTPVQQEETMDKAEIQAMIDESIGAKVQTALADALAAEAEELEDADELTTESADGDMDEMPDKKKKKGKKGLPPEFLAQMGEGEEADAADDAAEKASEALNAVRLLECKMVLNHKIEEAKLPGVFAAPVRRMFEGKIFKEADLDAVITEQKKAQAEADPSGRATEANDQRQTQIKVFDEKDKKELMLMRKLLGDAGFRQLESMTTNDLVSDRLTESYQNWLNSKTNVNFNGRLSELLRDGFMGGHWSLDEVSYQEALSLATVIKNTVNIMIAVDYAGQNRWYEQIVDIEQSDNPIDDTTFARLFGADTLDVVAKGAAYTEMKLDDEEETAGHVKQGNYVAVNLEDLMADKIGYFRNMSVRLADAWYNTLSAKVAAVFTVNSNTGPVLSDTGALFNATAVSSAGGHANLLTTALSYSAYDAVITAMTNQTARPLGDGRKLVDMGPFYLLTPNALRSTANIIRNSEKIPGSANNDMNPYGPGGDQPTLVRVPEWTDTNDWAVMARYRGKSPIKLVFPAGMRTPQIFTAEAELAGAMFTNDTIRYKLRMMTYRFSSTYDCAPVVDWRLLHKSNV